MGHGSLNMERGVDISADRNKCLQRWYSDLSSASDTPSWKLESGRINGKMGHLKRREIQFKSRMLPLIVLTNSKVGKSTIILPLTSDVPRSICCRSLVVDMQTGS
jgi:hypothetical protein